MAKLDPNYPFALKKGFLGKLSSITFAYLSFHIMQQYLKNILQADNEIKLCVNLGQTDIKLPICSIKGDFLGKPSIHLP